MSKIKFLPKKILESLNENQTYPSSLRHGKSAVNSYFDDSKTVVFNNNENISLPSTANVNVINKLGGFGFQTDININGKTNSEASLFVTNLVNNEKKSIEPYTEDNIPDDFFYSDGTTFLTSPLKDKDIINIKLPIPRNEYFSGSSNKVEILTLSPGTTFDNVNEHAGWLKTEIIINPIDKGLNFKKAFTDPLGNIVNHNLNNTNSYSQFINEITSQSLNRSNFSDNLKIKLSNYINKPFVVEKVNITFYGTPSTNWLNSKTKLNYSGSTYTMSGSAITAILAATNSGYYKTIFTGTITSTFDLKDQELKIVGANNEIFPIGFNTWSTPTFEVSNSSLNKITLKGNSSFSNGAVQFIKSSSYDINVTLLNGNIHSTKKIGRSNSGFNSGYSKFSNEYNLPYESKKSVFEEDGIITLLGGFYNHIINNFKTYESPCVLKPNDSLIFTLSKYIGENGDSFIIGGNEIEPSETDTGYLYEGLDQTNYISITLYGSYLNLNKEIHDLYNQNTVTDCVHETIGDDIITDDYNCYPVNTLSGSLLNNSKLEKSNFLTEIKELGQSLNNVTINDFKWNSINSYETNSTRITDSKKLFQTITGSTNLIWYQESILSSSLSELKNKLRYTQVYDNNEYYYDSLTPSFDDILKNQNKKIMNLKISGFEAHSFYDGIIFISNNTLASGLEEEYFIPKKFILENWQFKYPYDDEFADCRRFFNEKILLQKENGVFNNNLTTGDTKRNLNTDLNLLISIVNNSDDYSKYSPPSFKTYCDILISKQNTTETKFVSGLSYRDYKKVLFGSKGGTGLLNSPSYKQIYQYPLYVNPSGYTHYYHNNVPHHPTGNDAVPQSLALVIAPIISGWKYGLYNGVETQTKMHWSMNHYGHFRDLIEQRQYTTFYYLKGKNSGVSGVSSPAINIFFVDPITQAEIDPELTDSSNLNYDASSSRPYFDGEFKNRTYTNFTINNPVVYSNNVITQI